jgi:hypothetical protein
LSRANCLTHPGFLSRIRNLFSRRSGCIYCHAATAFFLFDDF